MKLKYLIVPMLALAACGSLQAQTSDATPSSSPTHEGHWRHHDHWLWNKLNLTDAQKQQYTMRRVEMVRRFEKSVFVRSRPFAKDEQLTVEEKELGLIPKQPLLPGERILGTGAGELKSALTEMESQPQKDGAQRDTASQKNTAAQKDAPARQEAAAR